MRMRLNILQPKLPQQRYSCHACGNCCRDFTVQLREEDIAQLNSQNWQSKLGQSPIVEFRGTKFLKQTKDGACIFWMDDGRCRIHAEYSFEEKPIACQMFPFSLTPVEGGAQLGINFACQSVLENKGADLQSHLPELQRMSHRLPEVEPRDRPPMLTKYLRATKLEVKAITKKLDDWLKQRQLPLAIRLDGLAWLVSSLSQAKLEHVRDDRFADLLDALTSALPDELSLLPIEKLSRGQHRMLRQAAFARTEDPKVGRVEKRGRVRVSVGQFRRSRQFASGRGIVPQIGEDWPSDVRFDALKNILPPEDAVELEAIDDLITRWLRATILGGRAWDAGFYAWPIVDGLHAMVLNIAVVGWLTHVHAAGEGNVYIDIKDVRAAVGRVDRSSGRAKWLGSRAELWRLKYLSRDHSLRGLVKEYSVV